MKTSAPFLSTTEHETEEASANASSSPHHTARISGYVSRFFMGKENDRAVHYKISFERIYPPAPALVCRVRTGQCCSTATSRMGGGLSG